MEASLTPYSSCDRLTSPILVRVQVLLDFSRDFDVSLMDNVVMALYTGSGGKEVRVFAFIVSSLDSFVLFCLLCHQQQVAQQVLAQFQEHPDAWQRVPVIMESSNYPQTKVRHLFSSHRCPFSQGSRILVYRPSNPRETDQYTVEDFA